MRFPFLLAAFLAVPLLEIAAFIVVGSRIGILPTIAIVFLTALAGSMLLRIQGLGALERIRRESEAGRVPGRELVHGAMILVAGFLLLLPGFVTDAIGLLLFLPFVRDFLWSRLGKRIVADIAVVRMGGTAQESRTWPDGRSRTIDLDEDEFRRTAGQDAVPGITDEDRRA